MRRQPPSIGLVVLGALVVALGGLLWYILRDWPYAPACAVLPALGLGVILAGTLGGRRWRGAARQVLAQLACLLILISVLFPVLWIVGMAMDPRDILRPLDLSPITNIPANLLHLPPKSFVLPEETTIFHLQPTTQDDPTPKTLIMGTFHALPEGWTRADLRRPDVWLIGSDLIAWKPIGPLPEGADTLVYPGQVTLLPDEVQIEALLPLDEAVRPDGWIVWEGRPYAVPRGWSLKQVGNPTLWLLDNRLFHWGILSPPAQAEPVTPLEEGADPSCYLVLKEKEAEHRYTCPQGYRTEVVSEPTYWLAGNTIGLCNGGQSSAISKDDLGDWRHSPAIWLTGRSIVDWRASSLRSFASVIKQPTLNPVSFPQLLLNSTMLACGVALFCVLVGTTAAYAFSRFQFPGRQAGMLGFVLVLMMPSVATLAPLYAILNTLQVGPNLFQAALWFVGGLLVAVAAILALLRALERMQGGRWRYLGLALACLAFLALWMAVLLMVPAASSWAAQLPADAFGALQWVLAGLAVVLLIGPAVVRGVPGLLPGMAAVREGGRIKAWQEKVRRFQREIRRPWFFLPLALLALGLVLGLSALRAWGIGGGEVFNLRTTLWGVGIAMVAGALPFSIWNMKGFIDTIPKELEEAALIDGASPTQTFFQIMLPLAVPGLAVTALFGFISGWTEFVLSWQFLADNMNQFTLAMALYGMQGERNTPWANFAAMSILVSIPVTLVFFLLQKYVVSGLTVGAVKG